MLTVNSAYVVYLWRFKDEDVEMAFVWTLLNALVYGESFVRVVYDLCKGRRGYDDIEGGYIDNDTGTGPWARMTDNERYGRVL